MSDVKIKDLSKTFYVRKLDKDDIDIIQNNRYIRNKDNDDLER